MPKKPDHPNLPKLDPKALPQEEQAECEHLIGNLKALNHFRGRYANALFLLGECNEANRGRPTVIHPMVRKFASRDMTIGDAEMRHEWRLIAFRDAAQTVYHFGIVLDGIVKGTHRCPTILQSVDESKLHEVQPMFEKHFPKSTRMRNAVSHSGEFLHSPEAKARNKLYYPGEIQLGGDLILGGIETSPTGSITDTFRMFLTFKKDVVSIELSPTKHDQMSSIVDTAYDAFRAHLPESL